MRRKYYGPRPTVGPAVAAVVESDDRIVVRVVREGDVFAPRSRVFASDGSADRIAEAVRIVRERIADAVREGITVEVEA